MDGIELNDYREKKMTTHHNLVCTVDWSEVINRDGFRRLELGFSPFLRRNYGGGWRVEVNDTMSCEIQLIDRRPEQSIGRQPGRDTVENILNLKPKILSLNFCPALRFLEKPVDRKRISPFSWGVDAQLRSGLTHFREVKAESEPGPRFIALDDSGNDLKVTFDLKGNFEFLVGVAVDRFDPWGSGVESEGQEGCPVERRRFRSDPEMDVGCSTNGCDEGEDSKETCRPQAIVD